MLSLLSLTLILIMTEDFNIRDNNWDLLYPHHLSYTDILWEVVDNFSLELSISIIPVFMWYLNSSQDSSLILDLIFLRTGLEEFNNHIISPNLQSLSDYTLLLVSIIIKEEFIQEKKQLGIVLKKKSSSMSSDVG